MYILVVDKWTNSNGVNTNGAAANDVTNVDGLGEKVRPGTSGKIPLSTKTQTLQ